MNEMRLHDPEAFAGRVEIRTIESSLLKGNPLGDPHRRDVPVYVPPGEARDLPVVFVLTGYTGRGQSLLESTRHRRCCSCSPIASRVWAAAST